jgi:transcriptional regulator with XRE-family HTH domain
MGNSFRENLREELDYQDITVKELAAKANVAKGALDGYLGKQASMPPADVALRIANALDVSVEYLVTGQEARRGSTLVSLGRDIRALIQTVEKLPSADRSVVVKNAASLADILRTR